MTAFLRAHIVDPGEGALDWQQFGACHVQQTDPELFFPPRYASTRPAKRVCGECMVRIQCLEYALRNNERDGVWGGLSERERRRLMREDAA